jgi:hypothetical protein
MRRITNDVERRRMRRTLAEVKHKLEEALRLSEQLQYKGRHDEPTPSHHRR